MRDDFLEMLAQPTDTTCGPTSLHAVYRHFGDSIELEDLVTSIPVLPEGGTLGVHLANHALSRGYRARMYTYNLGLFDPTWFENGRAKEDLADRLRLQLGHKSGEKFWEATSAYLVFIASGGEVHFDELNEALLLRYLEHEVPLLVGLSATYLYGCSREYGYNCQPDDVRGEPTGHFVVLTGYDQETQRVRVADPLFTNPLGRGHYYDVSMPRLMGAIFLGVMTYDGNLLVIEPPAKPAV